MHILDVPRQQPVQQRVNDHHDDDVKQVVLVTLDWWDVDVIPLNSHTLDLVKCKVFGSQAKCSRGEQGLE